ncbi:hypothetical protein B4U79_18124, partial [Dinothrombium tinctorium]
WIRKPKTELTYPGLLKSINSLPKPILQANYKMKSLFVMNERFYFITKTSKGKQLITFNRIPSKDEYLERISFDTLAPFTLILNEEIDAVFETITTEGSFLITFYTGNKTNQQILMTKGNSKEKKQVLYHQEEAKVSAIALFDYKELSNVRLGYISFGSMFKYFIIELKEEVALIRIISPYMDNQVLFGCPQTFCFYATLDAASTRGNNVIFIRGKYYWEMDNFNTRLNRWNAKQLNDFRTQDDLMPFVRATVDAAFRLKALYLIRQKRIYIEPAPGNVSKWHTHSYLFYKLRGYSFWFRGIDSAFAAPNLNDAIYLISDEEYFLLQITPFEDFDIIEEDSSKLYENSAHRLFLTKKTMSFLLWRLLYVAY